MGGENMNISKDELKEAVDKEMQFSEVIIGLMSLVSIISLFAGIIQLNLRLTIGSILATLLVEYLNKKIKTKKKELIRKMVEEYDKKGI